MSKLVEAEERLRRAMTALETSVEQAAIDAAAAETASASPAGDDGALAAEIAETRARCEALEGAAATVSGRLDDAIRRIKVILDD